MPGLKTSIPFVKRKAWLVPGFLFINIHTFWSQDQKIAATLNVLPDSILKSKYRLKKKLGLGKETDLMGFLNTL
ncbi:MAG: hypothetical protein HKP39_12380 [Eudoraea sp.]|nr:hypothetical protein [Eudoraea sp.]